MAAALPLLSLASLIGCQKGKEQSEKPKPKLTEVVIESPVLETLTEHEEFTGRLVASETVDIRARVSGYLEKVYFKDGDDVEAGQLLLEIDPRPYQAELDRTAASVAQLQARVEKLKRQEVRAQRLLQMKSISQEDFDTVTYDRAEAVAAVDAAIAAKDLAELNLGFTKIKAKISGRISRKLVDVGNLVQADVTPLAKIVALDPIHAYFDMDERTVLRLQRLIQEGKFTSARDAEIPIQVALADEDDYSLTARFNFIDNQVDAATGTLLARAEIQNPNRMLSPGLFVRLRVPIGEPRGVLLVHEESLGTDQGQRFVYVVNDQNIVEYRRVKTGWLEAGRRVINEGLKPGDRVVLTNLQRIRPKNEVLPKAAEPAQATATSAETAAPKVVVRAKVEQR
jgi:RND family efflux transporter MFP subunit